MFLLDEQNACIYSTKVDGKAIAQLVKHNPSFWMGVEELCAISEPLVKVLCLVDGEKPTMGYLYEVMDKAKEAIYRYYEDKGEEGFTRGDEIWGVIDEQWNNTLHHPIHATELYLNPTFSSACRFRFDAEVMDGFYHCILRMVLTSTECNEISKQLEVYTLGSGTFGYDMDIQDRIARTPDVWWAKYGGRVLELQKLAIRLLSQTCSSSGCEHN
eukprot:PITA_21372